MSMPSAKSRGSLVVVGTGIRVGSQTSPEATYAIRRAEKVLFLAADYITCRWIEALNQTAESMERFYVEGRDRLETYHDMVDCTLSWVRKDLAVCVAAYGHPGVFAYPTHEAIRRTLD